MKSKAEKKALGIYVHIPFCVRKCNYCDFLSAPADEKTMLQYVNALIEEIKAVKKEKEAYQVQTIYFGGGTPSLLKAEWIEKILEALDHSFMLDDHSNMEITLEVNPKTADHNKFLAYKKMGINRLSMGLQSTYDEELQKLGRVHNYEDFCMCYREAREALFDNINVDVMSALPGQTRERYAKTLERICALEPEHISSYSLIVEEGTPFWNRYGEGKPGNRELPDEDTDRQMYEDTKQILQAHGYKRYEISNYAKPGRESRHNTSYWTGTPYLGLGLGASSYFEGRRYRNGDRLQEYLQGAQEKRWHRYDMENIGRKEAMEEFMFLGLRLIRCVSKKEFYERFEVPIHTVYGTQITTFCEQGALSETDTRIGFTDFGIDVSNQVFQAFLLDEL